MRKKVVIKTDQSIVLSVSLIDILKQINKAGECIWKILWLQATGKLQKGNMIDFEEEVNNSNTGYFISFPELLKFAESVDQVIEILLIGSHNIDQLRRYESDRDMRNACDYCIELIDSSYWEISSIDDEFMMSMRNLP